MRPVDPIKIEARLLGWSGETNKAGPKVTLELLEEEMLERFKWITMKKAGIAGQIFTVVLVEHDGNGEPVHTEPPPAKPKHTSKFPGGFCGLAVMWCDSDDFRHWLYHNGFKDTMESCVKGPPYLRRTPDINALCVKRICGVESRKELDTNDVAREIFDTQIRQPYAQYLKENGLG